MLGGCATVTQPSNSPAPLAGTVVPDRSFNLTPSLGIPLEKLVFWGAYAAAAYMILDPKSPNWEIEEAPFPDNHIHLALKMKRYYAGGAGEARVVFNRRARELMQYGGFDAYEVKEYSEGMESSVLGSRRVSEGVIRLTRKSGQGDQGSAPPATNIPDKTKNPLS